MRQVARLLAFAALLCITATAPIRAQERSLPPPLPRGGYCGGLLPCAESGDDIAAHLRFLGGADSVAGNLSPSFAGSLSFTVPDGWAELGVTLPFGWRPAGGGMTFTAGPFSLWARLSPPILAGLGSEERHRGVYLAGWLSYDSTAAPLNGGGLVYPDTETYGLILGWRWWRVNASLYGAYQEADSRQYRGGEGGASLWLTLSRAVGLQVGGEVLGRAGQHDGQPGAAGLEGVLAFRFFDEYGIQAGGLYTRALSANAPAAGVGGLASLGWSIGRGFRIPAPPRSPPPDGLAYRRQLDQVLGSRFPMRPAAPGSYCEREPAATSPAQPLPWLARPSLLPSGPSSRGVASLFRRGCRVAGFMGFLPPMQLVPPPVEAEPVREEEVREEESTRDEATHRRPLDEDEIRRPGEAIRPRGPRPDPVPGRWTPPQQHESIGMPRGEDGRVLPSSASGARDPSPPEEWMPEIRPGRGQTRGTAPAQSSQTVRSTGTRGPYDDLKPPHNVGAAEPTTRAQRARMLKRNEDLNGGRLIDDNTGDELVRPKRHLPGVRPPDNEAHVDHVVPRVQGGGNDYPNLRVTSRRYNLQKGARAEPKEK
jgi:5-methylcytosine-specific restriction endonuclease McrA